MSLSEFTRIFNPTLLAFFQYEPRLHADVPRVACGAGGKTTQLGAPWPWSGSACTTAFEAPALAVFNAAISYDRFRMIAWPSRPSAKRTAKSRRNLFRGTGKKQRP